MGRETEIRELHQAVDQLFQGKGHVLLIEGEAGIGKSRLVREVGIYARLKGAYVLTGQLL